MDGLEAWYAHDGKVADPPVALVSSEDGVFGMDLTAVDEPGVCDAAASPGPECKRGAADDVEGEDGEFGIDLTAVDEPETGWLGVRSSQRMDWADESDTDASAKFVDLGGPNEGVSLMAELEELGGPSRNPEEARPPELVVAGVGPSYVCVEVDDSLTVQHTQQQAQQIREDLSKVVRALCLQFEDAIVDGDRVKCGVILDALGLLPSSTARGKAMELLIVLDERLPVVQAIGTDGQRQGKAKSRSKRRHR